MIPKKDKTIAGYHRRIERVVDFIRVNPAKSFLVKDLACHAAFSEFHFHRVFRAITGESVAQCIMRLRLEKAASALIYRNTASVTEIALDCGFSSSANFSKAFRKFYGCSATRYRQKHPFDFRISRIGKAGSVDPDYPNSMDVDIQIVEMPERNLASLRLVGPYCHSRISRLYSELADWYEATLNCPVPEESISITWSDSILADEETFRLDVCYEVPVEVRAEGRIVKRTLAGGRTACTTFSLPITDMHKISDYWDLFISNWLASSKRQLANTELAGLPSYEIYRAIAGRASFEITLCLPLMNPSVEYDDE